MLWKLLVSHRLYVTKTGIQFKDLRIPIMSFYAVAKGRSPGVFGTWTDCEAQVKGFPGARYKKFKTETEAQEFINTHGSSKPQKNSSNKSNVNVSDKSSTFNGLAIKRAFSTSVQSSKQKNDGPSKAKKEKKKSSPKFSDSEDSDDLNSIITKQLDDIEERLNSLKGVKKVIQSSTKPDRKAIMIEPQHVGKVNSSDQYETDEDGYVQVYTDGACSANGKKDAKAGIGVYWGEGHPLNTSEPVSGRATNNCGEIQAATKAIQLAIDNGINKLAINTDSKFLINSITKWIHGWKRKGWKLQTGEPVKNEKDFKDLDKIQDKINIKWNYVEAHKGILGNERADQLAKAGASMYR